MLPSELSQSQGSVARTFGHGLCLRCSWGRWAPERPYPLPPAKPPRLHKNRKGGRAQAISPVQVDPLSFRVCPTRHAAVWSPGEQLSASRPCGGRQRKAEEGSIPYRYPATPHQAREMSPEPFRKAWPWSLLSSKPKEISIPLRFAKPRGAGI